MISKYLSTDSAIFAFIINLPNSQIRNKLSRELTRIVINLVFHLLWTPIGMTWWHGERRDCSPEISSWIITGERSVSEMRPRGLRRGAFHLEFKLCLRNDRILKNAQKMGSDTRILFMYTRTTGGGRCLKAERFTWCTPERCYLLSKNPSFLKFSSTF